MPYENDAETGLNFAQARYQSSVQGRFTSVDPLGASAAITDPQSLNRYSYVQNDPMNLIDPSGMVPNVPGWGDVANGFWGKDLNDSGPHFGGPAAMGERLMNLDARMKGQQQNKGMKPQADDVAEIDPEDVIKINSVPAFHSYEEYRNYFYDQFGNPRDPGGDDWVERYV